MKVLHVFKTYLPENNGGIEQVIWQVAEGTRQHGVTPEVFTLHANPSAAPVPVGHHLVHQQRRHLDLASTGISLTALGAFRRLAAEADVVHYHFPWPMMDLLHLMGAVQTPSLVTYHSDIVKQRALLRIYGPLMHRFLGDMQAIVATSPNYLASSPVLHRYRDKVRVIPIGLDWASHAEPQPDLVARWKEQVGEGFFLFVGALRYYKGLDFLIAAARQTGLPVVVAGRGDLQQADLPPSMRLLGAVSDADKAALLSLCSAFVFPSHLRSEAFGVALLEAAFAGVPMISCEIGTGTSYVNAHGETGIVVPPADSAALATAMQTLDADPALRARYGAAAKRRAEALFRADDAARAYSDLYAEMLQSRHGG